MPQATPSGRRTGMYPDTGHARFGSNRIWLSNNEVASVLIRDLVWMAARLSASV
jgi:hypothetical protein